jgi:hypothetical protein
VGDVHLRRIRRRWLAGGVAVGLVALLGYGWRTRGSTDDVSRSASTASATAPPDGPRTGRAALDVEKVRAAQQRWLALARALSRGRDRRTKEAASAPRNGLLTRTLMEPQCILGPGEMCRAIADLVGECEDGDGSSCLAVGQFLSDEPPRSLVGQLFFASGCKHGEALACARKAQLEEAIRDGSERVSCEEDLFLCAWQAYRRKNEDQLDEACSLGVADACGVMSERSSGEPDRARAYLEAACQLGYPLACQELGVRLSPDCEPAADAPCYPPDPAEAAKALAIACEAGWDEACR